MNDGVPSVVRPREGESAKAPISIPRWKDGSPARLVTVFGRLGPEGQKRVCYVFDKGEPDYSVMEISADEPIGSIVSHAPAATWFERELHDQYGIKILGHPDLRPLVFHNNWPDNVHAMIDDVNNVPWAQRDYQFLEVQGDGITEVAVGPVHAGIIEPGHFRFSVVGDTVLHLELRHFYTHKGTEKLFERRLAGDGSMLAESVSGDNCFAHAVAYCQALENAFSAIPPKRAAAIRLIGLELERLVCHVSDFGGLCTDVGFSVGAALATRIKEDLLQASEGCCGTRYWRGVAVPGGLRFDLDAAAVNRLVESVEASVREFKDLAHVVLETPSIQNRFEGAGILKKKVARDLAAVGVVARASGVDLDVRRDHPCGHYRLVQTTVPLLHYGDVMARARIRVEEVNVSARLIRETAGALPPGPVRAPLQFIGNVSGASAVESPRGELYYWIEARGDRLTRCHIKSPSFQNWPAMPFAVAENMIADFPLINKSFNLSYSGCDR
jgi:Ni,Fe-hydrogenase III large subunit